MIDYFNKLVAITERRRADRSDAVGYHYARKACAIIERTRADRSDAISYRHARKAGATIERILTNLIILAVIVFGENEVGTRSNVAEKIIDAVISIEEIIAYVDNLALSLMNLFCIIAYVAIGRVSCGNVKR